MDWDMKMTWKSTLLVLLCLAAYSSLRILIARPSAPTPPLQAVVTPVEAPAPLPPLQRSLVTIDQFVNRSYAAVAVYLACKWLRDNYDPNMTDLGATADIHEGQAETAAMTGSPWEATVKGKLRAKGQVRAYVVTLQFEGMDSQQTVYRILDWTVTP